MRMPIPWAAVSLMFVVLPSATLADAYGEPLSAVLSVSSAAVRPGEEVELRLTLSVNKSWYVFADTPGPDGQRKLRLETKLPEGIIAVEDWNWPQHQSMHGGHEIHVFRSGDHVFKRKLKAPEGNGTVTLAMTVSYQACNPEFCAPVQTVPLSVELQIGAGDARVSAVSGSIAPLKPAPDARVVSTGASIAGSPLEMKFTALDGSAVDLAKLRGKVVLIDFWAMWCIPCVAELPNVKRVYEKYRAQGFEVIGVSFDDAEFRDKLLDFVRKKNLGWSQRFDGEMFNTAHQRLYGIQGIPATFLIDREGRLVERNIKGAALDAVVRKYISPPFP